MAQSWAIGGAGLTYAQSYFGDPSGFYSIAPVPAFRPALNGGRYGLLTAIDPALGGVGGAKLARVYCADGGGGNLAASGQFNVPSGYAGYRGSMGLSKLLRSSGTDGSDGHYRWGVLQDQKSLYIGRGATGTGRIYRADTGAETSWSNQIAMWAGALEVPVAPGTPAINIVTDTSIKVSWAASSDDGGAGVTGYRVQRATNTAFTVGVASIDTNPSTLAVTFEGLSPATTYYFRALASNAVTAAAGTYSTSSGIGGATTLASAPSAPGTPSMSSPSAGTLALSWSAPASNGGKSITGYDLDIATNTAFTTGLQTFTQPGLSRSVEGLPPGTEYFARVRAKNADKTGPNSATNSVTLKAAAPGIPTGMVVVPGTGGNATVTWVAPTTTGGKPITTYEVQVSTNPAFPGQATATQNTADLFLTLTGLLSGRTYFVRLRAHNEDAQGLYSANASARMPSGAHTSEGAGWDTAEVFVCFDGITWEPAEVATSDGGSWTPAE